MNEMEEYEIAGKLRELEENSLDLDKFVRDSDKADEECQERDRECLYSLNQELELRYDNKELRFKLEDHIDTIRQNQLKHSEAMELKRELIKES